VIVLNRPCDLAPNVGDLERGVGSVLILQAPAALSEPFAVANGFAGVGPADEPVKGNFVLIRTVGAWRKASEPIRYREWF